MAICKSYDMDNQQCLGTRERESCKCEGNEENCDFYAYKRENANHVNQADILKKLCEMRKDFAEADSEYQFNRGYLQGFECALRVLGIDVNT